MNKCATEAVKDVEGRNQQLAASHKQVEDAMGNKRTSTRALYDVPKLFGLC